MVRRQIIAAINEINGTLRSLTLLSTFLDSLLVFLLCVVGLMLISLGWYWSFIPGAIYFYIHFKKEKKLLTLEHVEEKTPDLREELRTSADNLDKDNEVVMALHEEVLAKMRKINVSDFIDFKRISRRLFIITLLCFLILVFSAYNVSFLNLEDILDDITNPQQRESQNPYEDYPEEENKGGVGGSIFGDESIAELGSEELDLQINLIQSEIDINDINDVEDKNFKQGYINTEIAATLDKAETDTITEHKDWIQAYYRELART